MSKGMTTEEFIQNAYLRGDKCPQYERLEIEARRIIETISLPLPISFVSIDFEHLYSQHVSACSVGMVKYIDGEISEHYYSRIKPPKDYDGKKGRILSNIHGFTSEEQFENERTMIDILPEIEQFVEGLPLVAHNATTEKYCIKDTADFYGLTTILDYDHIYDTAQISKVVELMDGRIITGKYSHKLETVSFRCGVEEKQHHNAQDDAEVCGQLMILFANKLNKLTTLKLPLLREEEFDKSKYKAEDKIPRADVDSIPENYFKGKNVCLTGFDTPIKSQTYGHCLWELGAILNENVLKKTDLLICGENDAPQKKDKAYQQGIEILNKTEFLQLLKNYEHRPLF